MTAARCDSNCAQAPRAIALIQRLSIGSTAPLIRAWRAGGPLTVFYVDATAGGLRLSKWMRRARILEQAPVALVDRGFAFRDRSSIRYWHIEFEAHRAARVAYAPIERAIPGCLSGSMAAVQAIAAENIVKRWADELATFRHLAWDSAQVAAHEHGTSREHVFVIAPSVTLADETDDTHSDSVVLWQPSLQSGFLYGVSALTLACGRLLRALMPDGRVPARQACLAATAAWGARPGRANDLFWWWKSGIASDRVLYTVDAQDHPADALGEVKKTGIRAAAMRRLGGSSLPVLGRAKPPIREAWSDLKLVARLAARTCTSVGPMRTAVTLLAWHHVMARRLSAQFAAAGVRGVFHYQETYADYTTYAAELSGGVRFGIPWSSIAVPCGVAIKTHHVFFCWGSHDARLYVDAGAISGHVLIAGCPILEMQNDEWRATARSAAEDIRRRGATTVLALFDTNFTPDFYRAFLGWMVECPSVGLLIKSKGAGWAQARADGLDGLVERGMQTGRVVALSENMSPGTVAAAADFAVGCVSPSAVVVSALAGSRILYVDYEGFDRGPLKPYAVLHSLGPNRCVFPDTDSLRNAVEHYMADPERHRLLGDISPILDRLDPFRDGHASERIGRYVHWYLEGLDDGLEQDAALLSATRKYAHQWGRDKVVRGLGCDGSNGTGGSPDDVRR